MPRRARPDPATAPPERPRRRAGGQGPSAGAVGDRHEDPELAGLCRPQRLRPVPGDPADPRSRRRWRSGRPSGWVQASSTGCWRPCPASTQHGCSYGEPGGFVRRLHEGEGTWLGHVLEHVAIELQNVAGTPVTFGKTRGTGEPGQYFVVYEYEQSDVGLEAGQLALQLLHSLLPARAAPAEDYRASISTSSAAATGSSASPRARRWARARRRWWRRPRSATSPGCGSTTRA